MIECSSADPVGTTAGNLVVAAAGAARHPEPMSFRRRLVSAAVSLALFLGPAWVLPRWWCGREADAWFDGDRETQLALARTVASFVRGGVTEADFHTGAALYDGEWRFATYQMAALGLCQVVREHPGLADELLPDAERALDLMLEPSVRRFDTRSWNGDDALAGPDASTAHDSKGHVAYLGTSISRSVFTERWEGPAASTRCTTGSPPRSRGGLLRAGSVSWRPTRARSTPWTTPQRSRRSRSTIA